MFCYQCQETIGNAGCRVGAGACGKKEQTAALQDVLLFVVKGLALCEEKAAEFGITNHEHNRFFAETLFATVTNVNFNDERFVSLITEAMSRRDRVRDAVRAHKDATEADCVGNPPECVTWTADSLEAFASKGAAVGVLATENEDVRSLRELLIYGIKGLAAYAHHAAVLGKEKQEVYDFIVEGLAATVKDISADALTALVLKAGATTVITMALLDEANTSTYGNPEITKVNIGVGDKPGILISGHDLKDLEELLKQTEGAGLDVYTHGEMLPAHYYPFFKKYAHLKGNYGGSWWKQDTEFASFNGAILMTTNCITPVKDSYKDRIFTTGTAGYPGVAHIADRVVGGAKDFSAVIARAKSCAAPIQLETGEIVGGFAHNQVLALADKVVDAVKSGAIKRFIVMAGCDGRHAERAYFSDVAKNLPADTVILTAGCAKYQYNKLALGDIGGIPRVLDAGQCNDCYSLAVIALKLKEVFALEDINELPLSFDIAWYEQKAVAVLLALLHLGVKGIRLGPTLPAFLSPNVVKVLVENFDIKGTTTVADDIEAMMAGR